MPVSNYRTGRLVVLGLLISAAALAVVAQLGRPRISLRPQSPPRTPRVAVLAFENLSGDPDLEIVASELTSAIGSALDRPGIVLLTRESTWNLTGGERGIETVASALRVDYVVAGSVDWRGGRIEVDAYLYRAGIEPGMWAERLQWSAWERDAIAGELSRRIENALEREPGR